MTDAAVTKSERQLAVLEPTDTPQIDIQATVQMLESWCQGDEKEQTETWNYLKRALDEDRLSDRKLFP
jgi:hypothetical protein